MNLSICKVHKPARGPCPTRSLSNPCRSTSEVSGIGVESSLLRFARQHFQGAVAFPMMAGTSLFLQANAAAMVPWGPGWQQKPTCISDRFASLLVRSPPMWLMQQCCFTDSRPDFLINDDLKELQEPCVTMICCHAATCTLQRMTECHHKSCLSRILGPALQKLPRWCITFWMATSDVLERVARLSVSGLYCWCYSRRLCSFIGTYICSKQHWKTEQIPSSDAGHSEWYSQHKMSLSPLAAVALQVLSWGG